MVPLYCRSTALQRPSTVEDTAGIRNEHARNDTEAGGGTTADDDDDGGGGGTNKLLAAIEEQCLDVGGAGPPLDNPAVVGGHRAGGLRKGKGSVASNA